MGAKRLKRPLAGLGISFADSPTALAAQLSRAISTYRADTKRRLAPVEVLVPHRAMAEWLRAELAAQDGVLVNLRWLSSPQALIEQSGPRESLTGAISGALDSKLITSPDFAPVRSYLEREGQDPARVALRRITLATRLAQTFRQYAAHWPEGRTELSDQGPDARWLGKLWNELAPAMELSAPAVPATVPLFVYDIALPGHDLLEALSLRGLVRGVFLRAMPESDGRHRWHRHGMLRQVGLARWLGAGAQVVAGTAIQSSERAPSVLQLDAPSHRRAAEAIAAQVWSWVRDGGLRFHEVGLAVPESLGEEFLPVLREVLDEAHDIPKVLWRLPLGENNRVVALAKQLLELPSTPLRRGEVMGILTHPLVSGAYEDDLPESWVDWVDAVGIFHGLDGHSHEGTYLAGAVAVDWDQGLQRLALGAFAGAERSGTAKPISGERGALLPEEVAQSAAPALGRMIQLVRSLLSDAVALREANLTAAEWGGFLSAYLGTYLRPPAPKDGQVRAAVLRALGVFETCGIPGTFPWDVARTLAISALDGLRGDSGAHLLQGLVVGTPADLHGLPFKRLIVVGVEQGGFPSRSRQDELDRRPDTPEHRPDDSRRTDAFHFHQLVEDAEGEVCLVPIARDPITGELRQPSLLVSDLASHAGVATKSLPLHRREQAGDEGFKWAFPEAEVEQKIRTSPVKTPAKPTELPAAWREQLGLQELPLLPVEGDSVIELRLSSLVRFLEYPTRGYAQQRLGYRDSEHTRDEEIDERFEHDSLSRSLVMGESLYGLLHRHSLKELQGLAAKRDPVAFRQFLDVAYERSVFLARESGVLPHGFFFDLQKDVDLQDLYLHLLVLLEAPGFRPPYIRLRWGQGAAFDGAEAKARTPVELEVTLHGKPRKVRISGVGHFISEETGALYRFKSSIWYDPKYDPGHKRFFGLAPWVEHLLLQAGGERRARFVLGQGSATLFSWNFPDLEPSAARDELCRMVQGLLADRTAYVCPSLGVLKHWESLAPTFEWAKRLATLEKIHDEMFGYRPRDAERHSPLRRVQTLRHPEEKELAAVMARLEAYVSACNTSHEVEQGALEVIETGKAILKKAADAASKLASAEAKQDSSAVTGVAGFAEAARKAADQSMELLGSLEATLARQPPDGFLNTLVEDARRAAAQAERDAAKAEAILEQVRANSAAPKRGKKP